MGLLGRFFNRAITRRKVGQAPNARTKIEHCLPRLTLEERELQRGVL